MSCKNCGKNHTKYVPKKCKGEERNPRSTRYIYIAKVEENDYKIFPTIDKMARFFDVAENQVQKYITLPEYWVKFPHPTIKYLIVKVNKDKVIDFLARFSDQKPSEVLEDLAKIGMEIREEPNN